MVPIETVYIASHSHTDIGFTDYQDLAFRQHNEFIDRALDLCEETSGYSEDARYHWVCEVTGVTERYLRQATPDQRDRFLRWHREGAIDVAGMQYNLTPGLDVEQLHHSLFPVRRLRDEYGLRIETAMQCDVDGVSWLFADLLPQAGVRFLTMAINPIRGGTPKPRPSAFWWEGPAGGRVLVWNGYHYLFGRSTVRLGDWEYAEQFLGAQLRRLEEDPDYPFDFLYCQATHPVRVDNGPPQGQMADFVRDWNADGKTPRLVLTTPSAFGTMLAERHGDGLPQHRGDWTDWWADGVASSAFETGLNRQTHALLRAAGTTEAWLRLAGREAFGSDRLDAAYSEATLYDEHTWGAFASIDAPASAWTRAQWNRKAGFAYRAWAEANDMLARSARRLAAGVADLAPEGRFNLGDLTPEQAYPPNGIDELLVVNTLPWDREVVVEEPERRGGAAPVGMLEMFVPRGVPWGGDKPDSGAHHVAGRVPAQGTAFLSLNSGPTIDDLDVGYGTIENEFYRVRIDPVSGAVGEWYDKTLRRDFAGTHEGFGLGQYVYERIDSWRGRDAIFAGDFSDADFGHWLTEAPFQRSGPSQVRLGEAAVEHGQAVITVEIAADGVHGARCRFALPGHRRELRVDWTLDKTDVTEPEAVFIAFPFALGSPVFTADLNGVPCRPDQDQLEGAVRDWFPVQEWVDVSDGRSGVTLAPLDAPLVQLGGFTTARDLRRLMPESAAIMSWALQNHWMVNFKASQGGEVPLRYRLTTHRGPVDLLAAARFGAEQSTPPLVLRDFRRRSGVEDEWRALEADVIGAATVQLEPATFGEGVVARFRNLGGDPATVTLGFPVHPPRLARRTSPLQVDGEELPLADGRLTVELKPFEVASVRLLPDGAPPGPQRAE